MNQLFKISHLIGLVAMLLITGFRAKAQNTASCNLTIGGTDYPVTASLPVSSPSGLDFNLTITLPGLGNAYTSCSYSVIITTGNEHLVRVAIGPIPFTGTYPIYQNTNPIPCNIGQSFPLVFKFKPGITCNGEVGDFNVVVNLTCTGQTEPIATCSLDVSLTAVAKNWWKVTKQHVFGNAIGYDMEWKIILQNTNLTPGIGDYDIALGSAITDEVSCSDMISVEDMNHTPMQLEWLAPNKVRWHTLHHPSNTYNYEYYVKTKCTDPTATEVTNCLGYSFRLGGSRPPCTIVRVKKICDTVAVTNIIQCSATISKHRIWNPALYNYAQGCEGEYQICFSNNGNIPITNINLTDNFPSGISVEQIMVFSTGGVNMDYDLSVAGAIYTGNFSSTLYFPSSTSYFSLPPTDMTLQTTSGTLAGSIVCVRVRFRITAPAGTLIKNCAYLSFVGTNGTPGGPKEACDEFVVEYPKALPGIKKCIITGQQSFSIGDIIPFRIVISNHGASPLSGYTLTDPLGLPLQNLEIIPTSVEYSWGSGLYSGFTPCGVPAGLPPVGTSYPFSWLTPDYSDLQNPSWTISGMPGECRFLYAYYLVIEFDAKVLPNLYGQYTNTATLTGDTILPATAMYNILDMAKIQTTKLVNNCIGCPFFTVGYVNPNNWFQFQLKVANVGSRPFDHIRVEDDFPDCAPFICGSFSILGQLHDQTGALLGFVPINCNIPNTFEPATTTVLNPGDYLVFAVSVLRANDGTNPCCNEAKATGIVHLTNPDGTPNDVEINDTDGPVCVYHGAKASEIMIQSFSLQPATTAGYWNLGLNIAAGTLPIQEVEIALADINFTYNYPGCQPQSMPYTGHLATTTPLIGGGLMLSPAVTPLVNNSLRWRAGTPALFSAGQTINLHIWRPATVAIPACAGKLIYCLKVRLKDVKGRVYEELVCGEAPLGAMPAPAEIPGIPDVFQFEVPAPVGN